MTSYKILAACGLLVSVAAASGVANSALAQAYPSKPIRMVIPVAVGGAADSMARIVADRITPRLGQPVIVDNRPGGNSQIGAAYVLAQPADGYTLLESNSVMTLRTAQPKSPYDMRTDFTQVMQIGVGTYVVYVNANLPVRNMRELFAYGRANPGKLNLASVGNGTATHLAIELLAQVGNFKMVHVPYAGSSTSIPAVVAGQADGGVDGWALIRGNVEAGKLRALGVTAAKRIDILADLPGMEESGVPGYDVKFWIGFSVKKGTPKEATDRLSREIGTVLADNQVKASIRNLGTSVTALPGDDLAKVVEQEVTMWGDVMKSANIKLD